MSHAFTNCENLVSLDISNLDTSNVTIMECIFFNCHSLTTLNLYNFNTSKTTDMFGLFFNCSSLTSLDLSSFNLTKTVTLDNAFSGCNNLKTIITPKKTGTYTGGELPTSPDSSNTVWVDSSNNVYTTLPTNMTESIMLIQKQS